MARASGWPALFRSAFKRSRNAMVLLDDQRAQVDANPAYLELLRRRNADVIGRPIYDFVADGPLVSAAEWRATIARDEFSGVADLVRSDSGLVTVQFAGHPETATGKRLVLLVALNTARHGRRLRDETPNAGPVEALSRREQEVVRLIGAGSSGPEIADELQISHNTVRTHAFNAMTKLNARSRAHLVAKALAGGHALR
jgi:DNA-binding CsgD family transcriptional regulator